MSRELKLFVETKENVGDDIYISSISAETLGIRDGDLVQVSIPEENFSTTLVAHVNESLFDFVVQIDENLPEILGFKSMELTVTPASPGTAPARPARPAKPGPAPGMAAGPPRVPGAAPPVPVPPGMMGAPPAPGVPPVPKVPAMPGMPGMPSVPKPPAVPAMPGLPSMGAPAIPRAPTMGAPAVPKPPSMTPGVPAIPKPPSMAPGVPAIPKPPAMAPGVPAVPKPPSMAPAVPAPAPVPAMPKPPAPAVPAPEEFEIRTETQWVLVPNQVDSMGVMIVDGDANCVFGTDDMGYPLDSTGQPFQQAQYLEKTVETKVPKKGAAAPAGPPKEKVQVLVPNQVDSYGVEIVDANNNPVYGMDPSGWYAMDSAGQAFEQTQWMEIEVEKQPEKGPFPPNMTDAFGVPVVDDKGFAIYGQDEFNQPLDQNGKGVWWEGSSRPKYPDMIDIAALAQKKNGIVLTPRVDNTLGDKFMLSARNVEALGLYEGMMIEIEDHKTRGTGAGRIKIGSIEDRFIGMTQDAYDAANIVEKDDVVVSSAEP
ncbi:MAG: hypothetical protein Q6365_019675, partial [Candidatus Sigynarchaeota archaeon]